ncbi:DUF3108 domain-containing protein [Neptunicella sp. SCSIO 80796]|uniref:DUF3108 domain-containing protein n=1 Tax=Neptunicella plasticusilytica TaxID=3117012 RepID=UPI003A4E65EE
MLPIRFTCIILLCLSLAVTGKELCPYQAKYNAYRSGSKLGTASQQLETLTNNQYRLTYQSHASYFFLSDHRHEISQFSQLGEQLQSVNYQYKRTGTGRDKSLAAEFNPTDHTILLNNDEKLPWQQELDNQLYQFRIKQLLAEGKTEFSIPVLNYRGEKEMYQFEVQGEEELALPYDKVNALKVVRIRETKRRETFIWFAPSLNYLMVRIRQLKEDDEQGDIRLSQYAAESCTAKTERTESAATPLAKD